MNNNIPIYFSALIGLSVVCVTSMVLGLIPPMLCMELHLFLFIGIIVTDYAKTHRITLFQIWNVGYIYILWSEMMLRSVGDLSSQYINSSAFLLIANNILMIGYLTYSPRKVLRQHKKWVLAGSETYLVLIVTILLLFVWGNYGRLVTTISSGRQMGSSLGSSIHLWSTFMNAASLMVSAMAAYYFRWYSKASRWWSLLFILPVFLIQMLLGTRFRLVYMLLPWLILMGIVNVRWQQNKKLILLFFVALLLTFISNFVKEYRSLSFDEMMNQTEYADDKRYSNVFVGIADKMSPEGCVRMTRMAEDYFSTHEHTYGKEIGFMFYWIIPRALWKDKPTPIDHWLIRKYEIVPENHSTASGFVGEIRADFGYFCLIIVFFWGWLLKYADVYVYNAFRDDGPYLDKLFASLIYPCVFFFVRSPLTATQSFFIEILIFLLVRKWLGKRISTLSN